jgi:uncharacterized protein
MAHTRRSFLLVSAACGIAKAQVSPKPDMFAVAASGDVRRATEVVDAYPEIVRSRSTDLRTPLHYATAAGKPEMVTFLLTRGAELSAGPESPLLAAVDFPDKDAATAMALALLSNGSDPNARRRDGMSALRLAGPRGYADICEMLVHRGAVPDARDMELATGDAARILRHASAVELAHYDRRYLRDLHGKSVVRDDTSGLYWRMVNEFVRLSHFDFEKVRAMHSANRELLNTRASWDEIPIEAAAHTAQLPMAQWLADQGAPVSTCTAALLGLGDLVSDAIDADPLSAHERGAHDLPILAYTVYGKEQAAIASTLLKAGANVNAKAFGLTTLHLAASKGYTDLASILIEKGADVNLPSKARGEMVTPLAVAIQANQPKIEKLLKEKGARI